MLGGIIAAATSAIGSQIKGIEARNAEDRAYTKQKEAEVKKESAQPVLPETKAQKAANPRPTIICITSRTTDRSTLQTF